MTFKKSLLMEFTSLAMGILLFFVISCSGKKGSDEQESGEDALEELTPQQFKQPVSDQSISQPTIPKQTESSPTVVVSQTQTGENPDPEVDTSNTAEVVSDVPESDVGESLELIEPLLLESLKTHFFDKDGFITIEGQCSDQNTIVLEGEIEASQMISPVESLSMECSSGMFSFELQKSDGTFDILVSAMLGENKTKPFNVQFTVDSIAPSPPSVVVPATSPITTGNNTIDVIGQCEIGATVYISNALNVESSCESGEFNFSHTVDVSGVSEFSLLQIDQAGNSSESSLLQWNYDPSLPPTPALTNPLNGEQIDVASTMTISGDCVSGNNVVLGGDILASEVLGNSLTIGCVSNGFLFELNKVSEGEYSFFVNQEDSVTLVSSANKQIFWTYDATSPVDLVIQNPSQTTLQSSGPLLISGLCEKDTVVQYSGSSAGQASCGDNNQFQFNIDEASDGVYSYDFVQIDLAGNNSNILAIQWTRDTSIPATPLINSPSVAEYSSNTSFLTISGTCSSGMEVSISGDLVEAELVQPLGSLTQTCQDESFIYKIDKSLVEVDGQYQFSIKQTGNNIDSNPNSLVWNRDITNPVVSIDATPTNPNLIMTSRFEFAADDGLAVFECDLDGAGWQSCQSPYLLEGISNDPHTFQLRAKDQVGNLSDVVQYQWQQGAYSTVALFHFNNLSPLEDSSQYSGANESTLTDSNSTLDVSGKFSEARGFTRANSQYLFSGHKDPHNSVIDKMTIEAWIKPLAMGNNQIYTIISKQETSNMCFDFGVKKKGGGGNYNLNFSGSLDGQSMVTRASSNFTLEFGVWQHVAMVWNKGSISFYHNGNGIGGQSIGTIGVSLLFLCNANLEVGRKNNADYFDGSIDELRISQEIRYQGNFTPAGNSYIGD